jgi:lipopolysaccharide/colanic/teichoic acid biosynthesis glycosyltransferase
MRVFHVVTTTESLIFLKRQAAYMLARDFEFHAVSSPGPELARFGESERATTHAVLMTRSISPVRDLISVVQLYILFRRERPDIVHTHTPKAGLVANIAAWLAGVPCRIFHLHGLPHSTATGLTRTILKWSTKVSSLLATDVFAVSKSVADTAMKEGLCPAGGIKLLAHGSSNGVDANRFDPDTVKKDLRQSTLGLSNTDLVIGFAGRLVRDKGVRELWRSWTQIRLEFPNAYLLIAGRPGERDALPAFVLQGLQADPRVRMMGQFKDMPAFYAALDVFVLPTYREGLPTVILESAAMSVPAVASSCVGCVDALEDGVTGTLVTPGDAVGLTDAIRNYLNDADLRRRHGLNARARVLRDFQPEGVWEATLKEYQKATRFSRRSRVSKRLLDIAISLIVLALFSPLLLVLALATRLSLGPPVLFRQTRPGWRERPFQILKFRTMRDAVDCDRRPRPDGERLTGFGRFLRKTSLDELPELWNVLKGDMSLVGPRPLLMQYLDVYDQFQRRRHEVKPGITGWAQISGRNGVSWEEKFRLDVWYVDHQSPLLDWKILWRTLGVVIQAEGIAQPGHPTMPEFGSFSKAPTDSK